MKLSCPKYDKKSVVYKIWYLFKFGEQLYFVWETSIFCILNDGTCTVTSNSNQRNS